MTLKGFANCPSKIMFCMLLSLILCLNLMAQDPEGAIVLKAGHSEVLDLVNPLKRIAIANPEVADANVISENQLVINGKAVGTTTLIVWYEDDQYTKHNIVIRSSESKEQVILKVRFMEVNKSALKEFGSDFIVKNILGGNEKFEVGSFGGKVVQPSDPLQYSSTVDFFFNIPSRNVSSVFKALHEKNLISILASPNLSAQSGSEASFLAGGEFPIPIVSGSMGMQTVTIQYKEFGVKLKFTPVVIDTNHINIKVLAEVSSLDFENGVTLSGFEIPSLVSRKAETTVELERGQYLIIGGLLTNEMTQTVGKVPVLGHVPILGQLFSSKRYLNKESELVIALSPDIVHSIPEEEVPELSIKEEDTKKK